MLKGFKLIPCAMVVGVLAGMNALPAVADAAPIIDYVAVDLADVIPGEDVWRYDYTVSNYTFAQNEGFDIFFDPNKYFDIAGPSPNLAEWNVFVIQPDTVLPDDGIYSAIANVASPSLAYTFFVEFVWLGVGTPGSQPFDVNQYDSAQNVIMLQTGNGITGALAVPEPATLLLLSCGIGLAAYRRRRRF